jgi:predicted nuclease of predicted toxin-antitoxin system
VKFLLDQDVPDDLSYLLRELGHDVSLLRDVMPTDASDPAVLQFANDNQAVLVTCNRDDFLALAKHQTHYGIVIVIRRKTRAAERAALFLLLQRAGEAGLLRNVNFA